MKAEHYHWRDTLEVQAGLRDPLPTDSHLAVQTKLYDPDTLLLRAVLYGPSKRAMTILGPPGEVEL